MKKHEKCCPKRKHNSRQNGNSVKFQSRRNGSRRNGNGEKGVAGEMGVGETGTPLCPSWKTPCVYFTDKSNPFFMGVRAI